MTEKCTRALGACHKMFSWPPVLVLIVSLSESLCISLLFLLNSFLRIIFLSVGLLVRVEASLDSHFVLACCLLKDEAIYSATSRIHRAVSSAVTRCHQKISLFTLKGVYSGIQQFPLAFLLFVSEYVKELFLLHNFYYINVYLT